MSTSIRMIAVAVVALLLAQLALPAAAADVEGNTKLTGIVTVTAAPPKVNFTFYSDTSYATPTTQFTPQQPVYLKIGVSTDNQLRDVVITVKMFADNDPNAVGTPPSSTSPETYVLFTIRYDESNNKWVLDLDTSITSSSWSVDFDPNQNQPQASDVSGWFYIVVVPGKTAREADTTEEAAYKDWDVIVEASTTDSTGQQTSTDSGYGYTMYFYSEVSTNVVSLDFGQLQPKQSSLIQQVELNDGTSLNQNSFTITVVANGIYNITIIADPQWTSEDNIGTISLTTASPGKGEFKLEASTSLDANGDLANPVVVAASQSDSADLAGNLPPTSESGLTYTIYMKITLGYGIHVGKYTGGITVIAEDKG